MARLARQWSNRPACWGAALNVDFDWDDANIDHIAGHGVSPAEAEDAILDTDRIGAPARSTPTEKRRGIVGTTEQGRILFVSYTFRDGAFRVVTAFDASEPLRRRYRREKRR